MKSAGNGRGLSRHPVSVAAWLAPLVRLGSFLGFVGVTASAFLLHSIHANADEAFRSAGADSMAYPGEPPEPARQLVLNGVQVSFRTQTVAASVERALAHYDSLCASRSAGFAVPLSVQSVKNDERGYVACLDTGDGPADLRSLAERFVRFARTGDLSTIGGLRYAHAQRVSGDDATLLFTVWSDSALDVFRMLPISEADAEGSDPVGVPRPPGSQRLLSVWEAEQPSRVFSYRVPNDSELQFEAFYRGELVDEGWTILERHSSQSLAINGVEIISAERDGRSVTVLSNPGQSSETTITILATEPPAPEGFHR